MPYKRIAAQLGVSASSVHSWTKDIELSEEQHRRNLRGPGGPVYPEAVAARARAWADRNRRRRAGFQNQGRAHARAAQPLHMAGCMLYWAEGAKARNTAALANSDVHVLRFFWRFLRECFGLAADDVVVSINVYTTNGLSIHHIERYWLDALDLPRSCCRKHLLNHTPTSSSGKKRHKLPYGVCTLRVKRSTWLVQHIYGAIQEYGDFEEPRWLDGPPRRSAAGAARQAERPAQAALDEAA